MDKFELLTNNIPTLKTPDEAEELKKEAIETGYFINGEIAPTQANLNGKESRLVKNKVQIIDEKTNEKQDVECITLQMPMPVQYIGYFIEHTVDDLFNICMKAHELGWIPNIYILLKFGKKLIEYLQADDIQEQFPLICENEIIYNNRLFGFDWNMPTLKKKQLKEHFELFVSTCVDDVSNFNFYVCGIPNKTIEQVEKESIEIAEKAKITIETNIENKKHFNKGCKYPLLFACPYDYDKLFDINNAELFTSDNIEKIITVMQWIDSKNMNSTENNRSPLNILINSFDKLPQACNLLNHPKFKNYMTKKTKCLMFHHQLIGEEMHHNGINNWNKHVVKLWTLDDFHNERQQWKTFNEETRNILTTYFKETKIKDHISHNQTSRRISNDIDLRFKNIIDSMTWCVDQLIRESPTRYNKERIPNENVMLFFKYNAIDIFSKYLKENTYLPLPAIPTNQEAINKFNMFANNLLNFDDNDLLKQQFYENCVITGSSFAHCVCCDIKHMHIIDELKDDIDNAPIVEAFGLNDYVNSDIDCPIFVGQGNKLEDDEFKKIVQLKVKILSTLHTKNNFWIEQKGKRLQILNNGIEHFRTIDCFQIPFDKSDAWKHVAGYHLGCVRGYFDGETWYILPSAVPAVLLRYCLDIRFMFKTQQPISLLHKYSLRGFVVKLNSCEQNAFKLYVKKETNEYKTINKQLWIIDKNTNKYVPYNYDIESFRYLYHPHVVYQSSLKHSYNQKIKSQKQIDDNKKQHEKDTVADTKKNVDAKIEEDKQYYFSNVINDMDANEDANGDANGDANDDIDENELTVADKTKIALAQFIETIPKKNKELHAEMTKHHSIKNIYEIDDENEVIIINTQSEEIDTDSD